MCCVPVRIQRDTSVTNIETLRSLQVVHNMCCVPVRIQGSDQPFAVLQAINKDQLACFSAEDEVNMKVSLSTHVLRDTPVTII